MRRLAVIDLSNGKQPIFSEDGQKVIIFNGEIYNYLELRTSLIREGIDFVSSSDTEVILKLYEKYGIASFKMLDGMFAFTIYDKLNCMVYIGRDFFGEKPLYYKHDNNGLIWASELKSLMAVLNEKPSISKHGINLYLQLTYIPAPFTIYDDIYKLEANHYLAYDLKTRNLRNEKIHQKQNLSKVSKSEMDFEEAKMKVRSLVEESVRSRSISDVPIGTFLSGGVDSSIVSLVLAKCTNSRINTFSIGFEKKEFDETNKSRIVSEILGSDHHEFIIGEKDFKIYFDEIITNFDEPFADSSALPSFFVAHQTKKHVTVALTGDGGDEVFGGYNKYLIGKYNKRYTTLMPECLHRSALGAFNKTLVQKNDLRGTRYQIKKILNSVDYNSGSYYNIIKLGYSDTQLKKLIHPDLLMEDSLQYYKDFLSDPSSLSDYREVDKMISLEGDMLVKVDRTSMLSSLECRAPFLNKTLWDFTHSLPDEYLINGNDKKRILKKAFEKEFPNKFLEKAKMGFGVPVGDWLRSHFKDELIYFTNAEFLINQNIFNVDFVVNLVQNHLNFKRDETFLVWTFYCFQKWYQKVYEC
jgi:asparagine synthase (glutamine-hydrolysing)